VRSKRRQIIAYNERLMVVERFADPLGDLIRVRDRQAPLLAYFRNNVLHLFALPAVIACLLSLNRKLDRARVAQAASGICGLMRAELFLRWSSDELESAARRRFASWSPAGCCCVPRRVGDRCAGSDQRRVRRLHLARRDIRPLLERHFLTLALLQQHGSGQMTRRQLEDNCHLLAQRLSLLYEFNTSELPEKATFSAFIGTSSKPITCVRRRTIGCTSTSG
jgi:glycerol-3-phosphate O-acyltransferase